MEVNGQLHAEVALPSRKEPPVHIGTIGNLDAVEKKRNLFPQPGIEPGRRYID
jgi:hypothetical protein